MPIIGAEELAKAMYDAWKKRMDLIGANHRYGENEGPTYKESAPNRVRPRPRWEHLTSIQQSVWRDVARDIGGVLADAMGAV